MNKQVKRLLVVGPSWVGDMVMAQSLFMTLKQADPDVLIDVIAPAWSAPIVRRMPEVRDVIVMPLGHGQVGVMTRYRIGKALRNKAYDQAIIIPRSYKSALTPFFAHVPVRTSYRGEMRYGLINDMRPLDKKVLVMTVQRYVALGMEAGATLPPREIPYPHLELNETNRKKLIEQLELKLDRPVIGFMPGAEFGEAKRWPAENFAALATKLINEGYRIWLFGSTKDEALGIDIVSMSDAGGGVVNFCGHTELEDAIDLISLTKAVVTNDSGSMHIAAALGKRIIAIYGSSTPEYTPPLTTHAEILYLGLECSPCFERVCPLGHLNCLKKIQVGDVFNAFMRDNDKVANAFL